MSGSAAQPQFKLFWVAPNGTTNFIGDCQPDTSTNFPITTNTTACSAGPDLTTLSWVQQGEQVYTNRNNQVIVVSPCAPVSKTPLQTGKDFSACPAQIDQTKGIVNPEFKAFFVNPLTQQNQDFTTCQADPTTAVAIQKDFSACADVVGASAAQRQFQQFYLDQTGSRVNIGSCQADTTTSFPIQTSFAGCPDFVDQAKGIAEAESRQFYLNAQGQSVTVKDCAPDPATQTTLRQDYTSCPTSVNQAAGIAEDAFQLFYMDRTNTRQNVGTCTPDPNRLYVVQRDFTHLRRSRRPAGSQGAGAVYDVLCRHPRRDPPRQQAMRAASRYLPDRLGHDDLSRCHRYREAARAGAGTALLPQPRQRPGHGAGLQPRCDPALPGRLDTARLLHAARLQQQASPSSRQSSSTPSRTIRWSMRRNAPIRSTRMTATR